MSQANKKASGQLAFKEWGAEKIQIGALVKLDICEARLQQARAHGDDDLWSRYYLSWMALYKVAFGGKL